MTDEYTDDTEMPGGLEIPAQSVAALEKLSTGVEDLDVRGRLVRPHPAVTSQVKLGYIIVPSTA